ncbi:uncharacterized protein [Ptychodera flava]|uniref:uncharacterized protein n=1 Tax=Ptychodera flava TaxID=63121 RepID=UPI003969FEB6
MPLSITCETILDNTFQDCAKAKILDMLQDAVPDLTSTMAILQKLISFCKIKIGEWRQEEARKILCVEETKQKYKKMTTEELTADLCSNKMAVPTTRIQTCVALRGNFKEKRHQTGKDSGLLFKLGTKLLAGNLIYK